MLLEMGNPNEFGYSLEISDIENTDESAPWKQRIIRFIKEHAKYLD